MVAVWFLSRRQAARRANALRQPAVMATRADLSVVAHTRR